MTAVTRAEPSWPGSATRATSPYAWVGALVLAAMLHGGVAAFLWWKRPPADESDALGAPAMEIGVDLAAPPEEQEDLPPGPVADDSTASVAAAEQHAKVEEEAPKEQPKEAEDPDRVVTPDVPKETKQETPKTIESEANKSADSVASEAAAPPKVEMAKEAPKSTAPSPGTGASADLARLSWQKTLVAHLDRHKRYPAATRKTVQLTMTFTLDRLGHILSVGITSSSGDPAFDQAALQMMHKADPVPPPPPLLADEGLTFSMPVIFQNGRK